MKKIFKKFTALFCAMVCSFGGVVGFSACEKDTLDGEAVVCMPDGAPALAMAKLMHEDTEEDGITYRVVKADAIASKVSYENHEENADFCIMPLNAAAKLLGEGDRYVMVGAVTHGNLYIVSKTETKYTTENLSSLIGKKVGVLQINNVPGLTFKTVLNNCGVAWTELKNDGTVAEDKVNLVAIADATALATTEAECFVIAEPAATAQAKNGFKIVGDLQALYGGENGYPQAVLVGKKEIVEVHTLWMENFIQNIADGAEWLKTATGEQIVAAVNGHLDSTLGESSLKAPLLKTEVLARCGVRYVAAKDCKEAAISLLQSFVTINPKATAVPKDGFFWTK
ncbi:MAG: hypothetical protein IJ284_00865 [Clostridia bacterium]|nr:hypothetical protein [Clostridia bacterium]